MIDEVHHLCLAHSGYSKGSIDFLGHASMSDTCYAFPEQERRP
jgi:hypothetical protein